MKKLYPSFFLFLFAHTLWSQTALQQQYTERFPDHRFYWNEKTGMLHRAYGEALPIPSFTDITDENVEAASLAFLQSLPGWFEGLELEMGRAVHVNRLWYVSFFQKTAGLRVYGSEVELRINEKGAVAAFGFDVFRDMQVVESEILPVETIRAVLAKNADKQGFAKIKLLHAPALLVVPVALQELAHGQVVYQIDWSAEGAAHYERTWLNAQTGEVVRTENRLCHATVEGTVSGNILPELATDSPVLEALPHLHVQIGSTLLTTDAEGHFTTDIDTTTLLTAQLKGPYLNVTRYTGQDAKIEMTVQPGDDVPLLWDDGNSLMSERNVFYHSMRTYDFVKSFDPDFTTLDYPLKNIVEDDSATCNAFWNGTNIHYNVGATGCINSAYSASTIAHEYGHALNDHVYFAGGTPQGMVNITLHEAMADVTAALLLDEHRFALGFYQTGVPTRDLKNTRRYPENVVGQQHQDGLILGGSFWDLRELTSTETAYRLAHFAKYGSPDDPDLGTAFAEYYLETILADDDDGNLANGTPHISAINEAFCKHGIGPGLFFNQAAAHDELPNTLDALAPYPVYFSLQSVGGEGYPGAVTLHYSTNYFQDDQAILMTETADNEYFAEIPPQPIGSVVKYYFTYMEDGCALQKFPKGLKESEHFSFLVGDYVTKWKDDFETDQGWQAGLPSDNAGAGHWQRAIPQQTISDAGLIVQPGSDHSPNGLRCFVTGPLHGQFWYSHDVDGGRTTLTSPIFSGVEGDHAVMEYFKWYVHGAGTVQPTQDVWQVQLSNNGGSSWVTVEETPQATNRKWTKVQFKIADFLAPTDDMRIRFFADDFNPGSIVEALVDDFQVLAIGDASPAPDKVFENAVTIFPNPNNGHFFVKIRQLESWPDADLKVFDVLGKVVFEKNKIDSPMEISLEGLSNGVYWVQVSNRRVRAVGKIMVVD